MLELKRGDAVAICRRDNLVDMGEVDHVGAREVRLKNGSRWSRRNGFAVGTVVTFGARQIRLAEPGDAELHRDIQRARSLYRRLEEFPKWDQVPLDKLERIAAILAEKTEPAKGSVG